MNYRIAFTGASGTGKSTLAQFLADKLNLPMNPIGSRSVAFEMGFASPYDVDKAGKRAEFQKRLLASKRKWEEEHSAFVTDRTTADNLAYTMLHDVYSVDALDLQSYMGGLGRYTHIIYCPVDSFCNVGDDPARVKDLTYHKLHDMVLRGIFGKFTRTDNEVEFITLYRTKTLEERKEYISHYFPLTS